MAAKEEAEDMVKKDEEAEDPRGREVVGREQCGLSGGGGGRDRAVTGGQGARRGRRATPRAVYPLNAARLGIHAGRRNAVTFILPFPAPSDVGIF